MSSVDSAFLAAQALGTDEKIELISRIWDSIPAQSEFRPSEADLAEFDRRSAELDAGLVEPIPWEVVRDSVRNRLRSRDES